MFSVWGGTGTGSLTGIPGDPISDGNNLILHGLSCAGNSVHPATIAPLDSARDLLCLWVPGDSLAGASSLQ